MDRMAAAGREQFGAAGWWEQGGEHALLHALNPTRVGYLARRLGGLGGKRIADVGCGGGILAEALAEAGAVVTGVDPSAAAIGAAARHADGSGLAIDYREGSAADLEPGSYDAVACMEVLEHAADPGALVAQCAALLAPGGALIAATINRTPVAYASMIVGLEGMLGALPRGSHSYEAFVAPRELAGMCSRAGLAVADVVGVNWSFFGRTFMLSSWLMPANYMIDARRAAG